MNIQIGDKAQFSKTISESDIYLFAGITGDMNPVHINKTEDSKGFAGSCIAHGALISELFSTVIGMLLPSSGTIYMQQNSKYLLLVFIGGTVTATVEVTEILNQRKRIITLGTYAEKQYGEKTVEGYAIVKAPQETVEEKDE